MLFQTLLCASSLVLVAARPYYTQPTSTWSSQAEWPSSTPIPASTPIPGGRSGYTFYQGDGSTNSGWPPMSSWLAFEDMFNGVEAFILNSCMQFDVSNPSGQEANQLRDHVQQLSQQAGVDPRFSLAIIMEESGGCVRAPTTAGAVRNPGLMQSHNGDGTCNSDSVLNPCPEHQIIQMITDGVVGTNSGDGLGGILKQEGVDSQAFYKTARIYNSGSVASSGNLEDGDAKHCYASNIANWLTGWSGMPKSCNY
ncbi:hypothetical protein Egran_05702 [Elaphomyces granulatus]|uniref:Transglycosylase SLT domain-containing protein n=1 Tax=Elaphomyces granulatus TaxID=519963 RepID=A0A232LQU5_9EURO|nr:hypothetical protein Egran_05702 [Elaphomyces granulatus]